jgi:hypothetical protein
LGLSFVFSAVDAGGISFDSVTLPIVEKAFVGGGIDGFLRMVFFRICSAACCFDGIQLLAC